MPFRIGPWEIALLLLILSPFVIVATVVWYRIKKDRSLKFQKQSEAPPYHHAEEDMAKLDDKRPIVIECLECGTKNQILQVPKPNMTCRCGKCGAEITFLQTDDVPSKLPSIPAIQEIDKLIVTSKESTKWTWSDALKPHGCFSRSQFAFFWFIPILITTVFFLLADEVNELWSIIAIPWAFFQIYLAIIAGIRRLHDLNYSAWYLLLGFIPLANLALILYLLLAPGKENRWS